jgi:hypothetical protein
LKFFKNVPISGLSLTGVHPIPGFPLLSHFVVVPLPRRLISTALREARVDYLIVVALCFLGGFLRLQIIGYEILVASSAFGHLCMRNELGELRCGEGGVVVGLNVFYGTLARKKEEMRVLGWIPGLAVFVEKEIWRPVER